MRDEARKIRDSGYMKWIPPRTGEKPEASLHSGDLLKWKNGYVVLVDKEKAEQEIKRVRKNLQELENLEDWQVGSDYRLLQYSN